MDRVEAREYLNSLLNKNLRITSTDGRIFVGLFKCTDTDVNVVLQHTYEYRRPYSKRVIEAAENAGTGASSVTVDMTSRFLGLVVVPGEHIVRIEVEEFVSQMKNKDRDVPKRSASESDPEDMAL